MWGSPRPEDGLLQVVSGLRFPGRDALFLRYIATIAVPWQAYMVPQYIMMQQAGLTDSFLALILLQAFSAFGVFLMRQYYLSSNHLWTVQIGLRSFIGPSIRSYQHEGDEGRHRHQWPEGVSR
jgi:hypothetical protein